MPSSLPSFVIHAPVFLPALGLLLVAFLPARAQDVVELKISNHTFVNSEEVVNVVGIVNNKDDAPADNEGARHRGPGR